MTNYKFKEGYTLPMVLAYMENATIRNVNKNEIRKTVFSFCSSKPHERTIQKWFKEVELRIEHKLDNQYMKKWKSEYTKRKKLHSEDEIQLDKMFSKARSLGLIN